MKLAFQPSFSVRPFVSTSSTNSRSNASGAWHRRGIEVDFVLGMWFIGLRHSTKDFTELVRAAVDPKKADFAIITGIQIHSYGEEART